MWCKFVPTTFSIGESMCWFKYGPVRDDESGEKARNGGRC